MLTANECQLLYLFAIHSTLVIFSFWSVFSYACRECKCKCVHCTSIMEACEFISLHYSIDLLIDDGKINDEKKTKRKKCNFIELTVYCSHIMIFIAYKHVHITTKTLNDTRETIRKLNNASITKILMLRFNKLDLVIWIFHPVCVFANDGYLFSTATFRPNSMANNNKKRKKRNGNSLEQTYRKIN